MTMRRAGGNLHKKSLFREKNLLKMMGQNRLTNFRKYGIMEVLAASAAGSPVKSPYRDCPGDFAL